jgi:type I restriction enzyme S subunit
MRTGWQKISLGDCFRIKHGYAFEGKYFSDTGPFVLLTPGNFFEEGGFRRKGDKEKYYTGDVPEDYVLKKGDLIIAMTEQGEGLLGSSAVIPDGEKFLHNQRLGLVTGLDERKLDKRFLYFLFNTRTVRHQIRASASGVKVRHTSPSRIYEVEVDLPPVSSQCKIAAILSAYDDLIENNTRRIKILEEMAQAIYREWFVEFRAPGVELRKANPEEQKLTGKDVFPKGWEIRTLGEFVSLDKGISYKGSELTPDGVPMVNLKNIMPGGGFRRDATKPYAGEHKPRHIIRAGDIVLANTDLTQAGNVVGSPALVPKSKEAEMIFSHHIYAVRFPKESQLGRLFTYHLLLTSQFKGFAKGISSGTTVLGMPKEGVLSFTFSKPPLDITERFDATVTSFYDSIENLHQRNEVLKQTRDLLLPKLISGEVAVEELDIEAKGGL